MTKLPKGPDTDSHCRTVWANSGERGGKYRKGHSWALNERKHLVSFATEDQTEGLSHHVWNSFIVGNLKKHVGFWRIWNYFFFPNRFEVEKSPSHEHRSSCALWMVLATLTFILFVYIYHFCCFLLVLVIGHSTFLFTQLRLNIICNIPCIYKYFLLVLFAGLFQLKSVFYLFITIVWKVLK